jgi:glycosyltransferase involved in cell wall biosynthesis
MYIIVTPAKNEGKNLPITISSIEKQTLKPALWVIVDDGSTDNTPEIIEAAKKNHAWIHSICLHGVKKRDLGIHYACVCISGLNYAIEYCKRNMIGYEYIGTVDADMSLENTYFENLIKEFGKDRKLGIASGGTWVSIKGKEMQLQLREEIPCGGHRLWRKECFEETGGFPLTYAADSFSIIKAKLRGWKTKRFEEYKARQARLTCSAEGLWEGWKKEGVAMYYMEFRPLFAILRAIRYLFNKPYYIGLAYLVGYLGGYINKKPRINDEEIRYYSRYTRPREVRRFYWDKLKAFVYRRDRGER